MIPVHAQGKTLLRVHFKNIFPIFTLLLLEEELLH